MNTQFKTRHLDECNQFYSPKPPEQLRTRCNAISHSPSYLNLNDRHELPAAVIGLHTAALSNWEESSQTHFTPKITSVSQLKHVFFIHQPTIQRKRERISSWASHWRRKREKERMGDWWLHLFQTDVHSNSSFIHSSTLTIYATFSIKYWPSTCSNSDPVIWS